MLIFVVVYLVSPGYNITFNATEYEFNVNVHSPVGTVVFEALLTVENVGQFHMLVNFAGVSVDYGPYSINGIDTQVFFPFPVPTNSPLTIALDETLNATDNKANYNFTIHYNADNFNEAVPDYIGLVNVILHEIGKAIMH